MKLLRVVLIGILLVGFSTVSYAEDEIRPFEMSGNLGLGVELSALNLGVGPLVKYWITDNIGVLGSLELGYLTGYSIRGIYKFDKDLLISGQKMTPYAGIGYVSASRKDTFGSLDLTTKGSGPQIFGGVEGKIPFWSPNFFWTGEVSYTPLTLEATSTTATFESDFSSFNFGGSLIYYFPIDK